MTAAVYRLYDEAGALLYIGSTTDLERRMLQHLRWAKPCHSGIPAADDIRTRCVRTEVTIFATSAQAKAAEKAAILAEAPLLNRRYNPKRWRPSGSPGSAGGWVRVEAVSA